MRRVELFEEALTPYFPFSLLKILKEYVGVIIYLPENSAFCACATWDENLWILTCSRSLSKLSCFGKVFVFAFNGKLIQTDECLYTQEDLKEDGYFYIKYKTCSVMQRSRHGVAIETILIPDFQAKYIQNMIETPKKKRTVLATVSSPFFADYCFRRATHTFSCSRKTHRNSIKLTFRQIEKQVDQQGFIWRNINTQDLYPQQNWPMDAYYPYSRLFLSNQTIRHSFVGKNTHFMEEEGLLWFVKEKSGKDCCFREKVQKKSSDTYFVCFNYSQEGDDESKTVKKSSNILTTEGKFVEKVVSWQYDQVANRLVTVTKGNKKQDFDLLLTTYLVEHKEPSTWKKQTQIFIEPSSI